MKKIVKKIVSLAAAFTMVFSCACGGNTESVNPDATKIKIFLRDYNTWANEYIANRIKEFNDTQEEVYVEPKVYYDDELYWQAITAGRENGSSPDIYLISYNKLVREKEAGNIISIDKYLTEEQKADIPDNIWDMVEIDDKIYSYPWYTEPSIRTNAWIYFKR